MNGTTMAMPSHMALNCTLAADKILHCGNQTFSEIEEDVVGSTKFYTDLGISVALIAGGGLFAGLTMSLLTLDVMSLEVLKNSGTKKVRRYAANVAPLVQRHHLLLVALLLGNAACLEALPIFLDRLVGPSYAIVISVTMVLFFGEVLPQAVCSRYGLAIGSALRFLVWLVILVTLPISYPLGKLLDCWLGHEQTFYRRAELKELVGLHAEPRNDNHSEHTLTADEAMVIRGALDLSNKTVAQVMTPIENVFMISEDAVVDDALMQNFIDRGHSRVPVYRGTNRNHIVGVILIKQLIKLSPADCTPVDTLNIRQCPTVAESKKCYDMLNTFQLGKSHMAIVVSSEDMMTKIGLVTLEDILEELIGEEVLDETDEYVDMRSMLKRHRDNAPIRSGQIQLTESGGPASNVEAIRSAVNATPVSRSPRKSVQAAGSNEREPLLHDRDDTIV